MTKENMKNVIIRPIITESSMKDAEAGKFTFVVEVTASKDAIRARVEDLFKVHVVSVFTNIVKGGRIKTGPKKREEKLSAWKKARVTLEKGEKIDWFDIGRKE